jgi:hypothetical protein
MYGVKTNKKILIASSSLFTKISLEFLICDLFAKLVA